MFVKRGFTTVSLGIIFYILVHIKPKSTIFILVLRGVYVIVLCKSGFGDFRASRSKVWGFPVQLWGILPGSRSGT